MKSPFDPLDYLALAEELGSNTGEEKLRTAVSRAYYAAFLIARGRLQIGSKTRDVHREVIDSLKKKAGYTMVGNELDRLRKLRNTADYEFSPVDPDLRDWSHNWAVADRIVAGILPRLQRL